MAGRRCFSERIVESDAFYALSINAQALYYHLNQVADDDGFINNAESVALKIKRGKNALQELVEKRFLLKFKDIYVVKHWRISNSLKNDRVKPLTYAGIAAKIWIKENRAYTDHPVEGCRTLYEVKTGIQLESSWNPVGIPTEPNPTEPNRNEPNPTRMGDVFAQLWNEYPELRRGPKQEAMKAFGNAITAEESAVLLIQSLTKWKRSDQWCKEGGRYVPYLCNWLERGLWQTVPEECSVPQGASGELGEAELEAIRQVLAGDGLQDTDP